jgi:hypothetical protein
MERAGLVRRVEVEVLLKTTILSGIKTLGKSDVLDW